MRGNINYNRKDPFSSFSYLKIGLYFYKNVMVPSIKSLAEPQEGKKAIYSSEEYSATMFFNALCGYSPNTGTQILEHQLKSAFSPKRRIYVKQTRILPHPSQMNKYTHKFSMNEVDSLFFF